jgi:hypothetical protein
LQFETWWIAGFLLLIAWLVPLLADRWFTSIESFFSKVASKRSTCALFLFLATIAIRLLLLPILSHPQPLIHDEYSYLLQGDMFAHGRLAFPPHPMARYFETFYVTFHPTYSSMYPPAQGAALAVGQLLGNPWIGVLLTTAAMVAALLWMLQGWFPPYWALLGAILVLVRIGIFSYWMNSYWGGSVATLGAALVLGALPRLKRDQRLRDAVLLGIGVILLANSRPLEGFVLCIPVAFTLVFWFYRLRKEKHPIPVRRVVLPIALCLLANLAFNLYYDWRLTGNPFAIPRAVYYREYFTVSPFIWGKILPPRHYSNLQFEEFFNGWLRDRYNGTWIDLLRIERERISIFWWFFLGTPLSIPLLSLPWLVKDRRMPPVLLYFSVCVCGLMSVTWFLPHYAAPVFPVLVLILVQAFRHLRRWKSGKRAVGVGWTRLIVVLTLLMVPLCIIEHLRSPHAGTCLSYPYEWQRSAIVSTLKNIAGDHLVIVRYSEAHDPLREWVFNAADIDRSRIVWAREIPGTDLSPLLAYYSGRKVWVVGPDADRPTIYPYSPSSDSLLH